MPTVHFKETSTSTPEQFIAGLTDFGPGRSKLFPNSADSDLKVHDQGPNWADVTEGSRGIWERLRYDWSDSNHVVLTTTDSNTWGGASGHTYTLTSRPDGKTDVDLVTVRDGKNLKGRLLGAVIGTVGKGSLEKAFKASVKAIETRNNSPS
jgi:hypothetical protein